MDLGFCFWDSFGLRGLVFLYIPTPGFVDVSCVAHANLGFVGW